MNGLPEAMLDRRRVAGKKKRAQQRGPGKEEGAVTTTPNLPAVPTPAVSPEKLVTLRNILLATDFSSYSDRALGYALSITRRYQSKLYIAHIIETSVMGLVPPEAVEPTLRMLRQTAEASMRKWAISRKLRGVPFEQLVEEGPIWPTLESMIRGYGIDLVVMGTHGRTGIQKLLLGSIAEQVFRMTSCPVLTVGPAAKDEQHTEEDFARILYATDFSPESERAAAYALSLAQEHQAELTLLHVVEDVSNVTPEGSVLLREYFTKRLRKLVPTNAAFWCNLRYEVQFGEPVDTILQQAARQDAHLIVLGVKGGSNFPGHLPPATAYRVVCQAPCPVLTIRG